MEAHSRVAHSAGEEAFPPNNKLVIRDKAHASRRVLERPWNVCDYLMLVASVFILMPGSLAQIIQHSDELCQMYVEGCGNCSDDEVSTVFNGARAAKHRFESMCEPLCRLCKRWKTNIAFLNHVSAERGADTKAGALARALLECLDVELIISAGLLADAACERMALIRFSTRARSTMP